MKQFPLNLVFHCQMKPLVPRYNIISKLDLRAYSKWGIQSACKAGITLQLPVILLDYESDLLHQAALRKAFSVKLHDPSASPRNVSAELGHHGVKLNSHKRKWSWEREERTGGGKQAALFSWANTKGKLRPLLPSAGLWFLQWKSSQVFGFAGFVTQ